MQNAMQHLLNRPLPRERPVARSILFLTRLLAITFARQGFLHPAFFAGFQVERMPLNFLDNVLLLDFAFEAAQGVF